MKRLLNYLLIAVMALFAFSACGEKEPDEPVGPQGQPKLEMNKVSETVSSISFTVKAENAVDFAYLVKEGKPASNVSAKEIFTSGTTAAIEDKEFVAEGLQSVKDYTVYGASRNGEGFFSQVAHVTGFTGLSSFDVTVDPETVTHNSCNIVIRPSDENVTYLVVSYPTKTIENFKLTTDDKIHEYILSQIKKVAAEAGTSLEDLLSQSLLFGAIEAKLSGLVENAGNEIFVYAMNTKGERESSISQTHVQTTEFQYSGLTFELTAEMLSPTKAHIKAVPSNNEESYCLLGMPKSTYPDAVTAQDFADEIVKQWKGWLDQGIMLCTGVEENKSFDVIPGEEYVLCAFGYDMGITSKPEMIVFAGDAAGDPEMASYELIVNSKYSTCVNFDTKCSDPTVYYMIHMIPSANFSEEAVQMAKEEMEFTVLEYLEIQQELNPDYLLAQVVSDVCLSGHKKGLSINGMTPGETYTAFMYGMTLEGKATKKTQVFEDFVTLPIFAPSDAVFTTKLYKYFDGDDVNETDCFPNDDLSNKVLAVMQNTASEEVVKAYYSIFPGNPFGDNGDDYIIDACVWYEFDGKDTENSPVTEYGFYLLDGYNADYTVFSVAQDAEGNYGPVGKTALNAQYKDISPVSELEELMGSIASAAARISASHLSDRTDGFRLEDKVLIER